MVEYFEECNEGRNLKKVSSRISKRGKRPKRESGPKQIKEFYGDSRFKNGDYNDAYECRTHKEVLCFDIEDCDCECDEKVSYGDPVGPRGPKGSNYKIKSKYANKLIDYGDSECCGEACAG